MADDPLADLQNVIGFQGLTGPNPYLQYSGKIPMAGFYTGQGGNMPPTDALGRPIQSFVDANAAAQSQYQQQLAAFNAQQAARPAQTPGTTLNSQTYGMDPQVFRALQQQGIQPSQMPAAGIGAQIAQGQGMPSGLQQMYGRNFAAFQTPQQPQAASQQPQAAQPPSPPDMRQAYLDALSNPGKVTTPGAQMYPGAAPTGVPQPSVLDQFLATNRPTTGGGYSNQSFFSTLNALRNAGGATP